jgi:hypothetical protein
VLQAGRVYLTGLPAWHCGSQCSAFLATPSLRVMTRRGIIDLRAPLADSEFSDEEERTKLDMFPRAPIDWRQCDCR